MNLTAFRADSNPFVATLRQASLTYNDSPLYHFYQSFCPASVADLLGISASPISNQPAMSAVMPWWNKDPQQRLQQVAEQRPSGWLGKEAIKLGISSADDFGWQYFGPVSEKLGLLEFERQRQVYDSIAKRGYKPRSHLQVHGEFLVDGNDWVWVNLGGKHRVNALLAQGNDTVIAAAKGKYGSIFVRRSEVASWPNVVNGWYTEEEALQVFDRIMAGKECGVVNE